MIYGSGRLLPNVRFDDFHVPTAPLNLIDQEVKSRVARDKK